jgi:Ca2+-binding RTX toxin-like protein
MHLSPGMSTLLGTSGDDRLRVEHGFTTLLGGRGNDAFVGSAERGQIEKFYGGEGDDIFRWSPGFDMVHGGQPQLDYAADGTDVIDYSGAGEVTITFNRHWIPHKVPNYVAVFEAGVGHLFSVERIQWNAKTDRIVLGKGIDLLEDDRVSQPSASLHGADTRRATIVADDAAAVGDASTGDDGDNRIVGSSANDVIDAGAGDDTLYGGAGDDVLIGGAGSDGYVYLPGDGHDVIVEIASDTDVDELVLGGDIAPSDLEVFRIDGDLLLELHAGSIRISGFFSSPSAGIERVVFDHAPAWTREDLELRAVDALAGAPMPLPNWPDDPTLPILSEGLLDPYAPGLF